MITLKAFFRQNRLELLVFSLILLITLFLRVYHIDQYMTFLGDEGRDALVVKKTLTQFSPPLLGPPTSVGNMYLGPLYYYMMSVSMAILWLNPMAAAIMVALIGTATVGLIYYFGRVWFGKTAAIVAAVLYSVSPANIIYSRSSWNPNPAPFFTLMGFLGLHRAHQTRNFKWLVLTGGALAFTIQMHYLALILLPIYGLLWVYELFLIKKKKLSGKNFWKGTLGGIILFLVLMSPLVLFDIRHDFMNYKAISTFFLGDRATTVNLNIFNTLGRIWPTYADILIKDYISGENALVIRIVSVLVIIGLLTGLFSSFKSQVSSFRIQMPDWPYLALGIWLVVGVLGLALYKQTVYDHYLGFLNPAPFLLIGSLVGVTKFFKHEFVKKLFLVEFSLLVLLLVVINFMRSPLLESPHNQLKRTQEVAKFVIQESGGKPFNFALIAEHNYDAAYQYYLDIYGHKPQVVPFNISDQLFVVCEDRVCEPINHPKYEIAAFGWSKVESEQGFMGVKVFKLIHNTPLVGNDKKI